MQKLGINFDAVEGISYEEYAKYIKELGFTAASSDMTTCHCPESIAKLCEKNGLEYSFIHAPYKGTNVIWQDNIDGAAFFESLISCVNHCKNAQVPTAVVHISSGYNPPPISKIGKNRFKALVEHATNKGVNIAFENLRAPKYLKWAMNTFKEAPNVGFCWDIGHENCFTEGISYLKIYGDKLLCTHLHDNKCEKSGDLHLLPFDGKIDYEAAFENLKALNYKGALMLEVFAKNEIYDGVAPADFLKTAYESITKIQNMISC